MSVLFAIHAAATWAMVGLIWTVQMVVYPAMREVPADAFPGYERAHQRRMSMALVVLAPVELVTALLVFLVPGEVPRWLPFVSGAVLAALWIGTAAYYAPLHGRLARGFDRGLIEQLIGMNWLRTAGWTVRGALAVVMLVIVGG